MDLILQVDQSVLQRVLTSLEWAHQNAPNQWKDELTGYWKQHLSVVRIQPLGNGRVYVSGQSGFYFPGHTYSGLDLINTLDKILLIRRLRILVSAMAQKANLAESRVRTESARQMDLLPSLLALSIPVGSGSRRFGYSILGQRVSYDFLRAIYHVYSILDCCHTAGIDFPCTPRILEIGPGTGLMALVFALLFPESTIILVDLPDMLAICALFLSGVLPDRRYRFYHEWLQHKQKDAQKDIWEESDNFVFVPHYEIAHIPDGSCELAVNTDSMQEMTIDMIRSYFEQIRRILRDPRLFYQSNRRVKFMDGVGIAVEDYPYLPNDQHLLDRENEFMASSWVIRRLFNLVPIYITRSKRSHVQRLTRMTK